MTTVLIDGHHLLHRVCFIPELQRLRTRSGIPTGPIMGFLRVLSATLRRFNAHGCVVVWDSGRSAYRKKLYPAYKANRDEGDKPEALANLDDQLSSIQEILPYVNVKQLAIDGYEGDDLLYLLIEAVEENIDERIVVVTGDKDLLQLVGHGIDVYRPIADQLVTDLDFDEIVGIPIDYFVLRKALVGDKSDNIDGIRGVGEKTANKLLAEAYVEDGLWCLDSILTLKAHCVDHKTKTAKRIAENWKTVERNIELMDLSAFPFTDRDREKAEAVVNSDIYKMTTDFQLMKLLGRYEFNEILNGFAQWIRPFRMLV